MRGSIFNDFRVVFENRERQAINALWSKMERKNDLIIKNRNELFALKQKKIKKKDFEVSKLLLVNCETVEFCPTKR